MRTETTYSYFLVLLLLLTGCHQRKPYFLGEGISTKSSQPVIFLLPIEDDAGALANIPEAFFHAIVTRLEQQKEWKIQTKQSHEAGFLVQMQLVDFQATEQIPCEFLMSLHLKIYDQHNEKSKLILQEVFTTTTLLEEPLTPLSGQMLSSNKFQITPLGLAQAKLCREISNKIQECIASQMRGK